MVYTDINLPNNMEIKKYDLIPSKNMYRLDQIVQEPSNHVLYCWQDGPDRALVIEKLMRIPEDTKVTPVWLSEWK